LRPAAAKRRSRQNYNIFPVVHFIFYWRFLLLTGKILMGGGNIAGQKQTKEEKRKEKCPAKEINRRNKIKK